MHLYVTFTEKVQNIICEQPLLQMYDVTFVVSIVTFCFQWFSNNGSVRISVTT